MTALTIRKVPEELKARLRLRAAKAGRSVESEVRAILASVCSQDEAAQPASSPQDWVDRLYGKGKPRRIVDALITGRRKEAKQG